MSVQSTEEDLLTDLLDIAAVAAIEDALTADASIINRSFISPFKITALPLDYVPVKSKPQNLYALDSLRLVTTAPIATENVGISNLRLSVGSKATGLQDLNRLYLMQGQDSATNLSFLFMICMLCLGLACGWGGYVVKTTRASQKKVSIGEPLSPFESAALFTADMISRLVWRTRIQSRLGYDPL